jgi:hypothetical protein
MPVHAICSVYAVRRAASACLDLEAVHTTATAPATVDASDGASHGGGNMAESSGSGSGGGDGKQKADTLPSLISDTHPVPFSADGQLEQLSKSIVYSGPKLARYLDLMGLDLADTTGEPYTMLVFVDGVERVVGEQVAPALAQYALMVTGLIGANGAAALPKDFRIYPLLTVMQRIMRLGEPARAAVAEWVCALDTGDSSAVVARRGSRAFGRWWCGWRAMEPSKLRRSSGRSSRVPSQGLGPHSGPKTSEAGSARWPTFSASPERASHRSQWWSRSSPCWCSKGVWCLTSAI